MKEMEIKNVMLPTDFSEPSRMALHYAVVLARTFRARLTLLHVLEPQPLQEIATDEIEKIEHKRRENALQQLGTLLAPEDEDDLDLQIVVKSGNARKEIAAAVEQYRADILVLGTHGRSRIGRLIMGSTTEGLLRKLTIPILTVCHALSPQGFKRILFATDLSDSSLGAFKFALRMAAILRAEIIAIHALGGPVLTSGELDMPIQSDLANEACRRLEVLVKEGKHQGVEVQALVVGDSAAVGILNAAVENLVDLIFLTISKKGIVERALLGTTAERVARDARVPVLFIPVDIETGHENVTDMHQNA
jgi:nucleotide-binding universal stress UspA family protein